MLRCAEPPPPQRTSVEPTHNIPFGEKGSFNAGQRPPGDKRISWRERGSHRALQTLTGLFGVNVCPAISPESRNTPRNSGCATLHQSCRKLTIKLCVRACTCKPASFFPSACHCAGPVFECQKLIETWRRTRIRGTFLVTSEFQKKVEMCGAEF